MSIPVVPHKAVAEVSKIGNLLQWSPHQQLLNVVWCSAVVVVVVVWCVGVVFVMCNMCNVVALVVVVVAWCS